VEIDLPDDNDDDSAIGGEYTLVFNEDSITAAYKAAKEAAEKVREESLASINNCHLQSYSQVKSLLMMSSNEITSPPGTRGCAVAGKVDQDKRA